MIPDRIKLYAFEIAGSGASIVGAVTANQEQIDWYLRQIASVGAIVVTVLTIVSLIRKERRK